jgi:uncharacterized protein YjbI with pentapeptide repeats
MTEAESEKPEAQKRPRFNQEQYETLLRCSEKKDMTEWNEWRKECPKDPVFLEGSDFEAAHLNRAHLSRAHLKGAYFGDAQLEQARLIGADLTGAKCHRAYLKDAVLFGASLKGTNFDHAHLEGAGLTHCLLKNASFKSSHLQHASFHDADLEGANLLEANLQGANLKYANLQGANFRRVTVDGATSLWKCEVSCHTSTKNGTDFSGVGLHTCRIDPGTRQLLEYNVRRMNWQDWYKQHPFWHVPLRIFWAISDYGVSAPRIAGLFFLVAVLFAAAYYVFPNLVHNLHITGHRYSDMLRACYFSVVTMTTLGFGDMYANPHSALGHILLIFQVLLGYVFLGALVTRFAVLFTAGGPAAKFVKDK